MTTSMLVRKEPSHEDWMGMEGLFYRNELILKAIQTLRALGFIRPIEHPELTENLIREANMMLPEYGYPWIITAEQDGVTWPEQRLIVVHRNFIRMNTTC